MKPHLSLLGLVLLAGVSPLRAQDHRIAPVIPRVGFGPYVEFGGSLSRETTACDECKSVSQVAMGIRSGGGWQFTPRLRIGVEILGSFREDPSALQNLSHMLVAGQIGVTERLHLRLGIGQAKFSQGSVIGGERTVLNASGAGWMVGVGSELPLSRTLVIAPSATFRAMGGADLERNGSVITRNQSFKVFEVGVGIRYHLRDLLWPNPRDRAPG